jgi:hypothetical protein
MSRQRVTKASSPRTIRTTITIDAEAWERMMIHSIKMRMSAGAVMTEAISHYCKSWGLPANLDGRRQSPGSARDAAGVEPDAGQVAA